jgi:nitrogen regulatory protein PII-like uncharacterized protein
MSPFKKPEFLVIIVLAIVLIGYIAYDYRKHNSNEERLKRFEENLATTAKAVGDYTTKFALINTIVSEIRTLKEEIEEVKIIQEKCDELVDIIDELITAVNANGINIDVDLPEFIEKRKSSKKSKKSKSKNKRSKRSKRSKKEVESNSSDDEDDSSDEDEKNNKAMERLSRVRNKSSR